MYRYMYFTVAVFLFFLIALPKLSEAACANISNNLYFGVTDSKLGTSEVSTLQQILISGGYLSGTPPTGYFGNLTMHAVELYQASHNISATGFVGPLTRTALQNQTCTSVQGIPSSQIPIVGAKPKILYLSNTAGTPGELITIHGTSFDSLNNTICDFRQYCFQ